MGTSGSRAARQDERAARDCKAYEQRGGYGCLGVRSNDELDVPFVHIWSLRDGKAWRFRQFLDTAGSVEALSLEP